MKNGDRYLMARPHTGQGGSGGKSGIEDKRVLVAAETVIDRGFLQPINPI
jgi:hypothetical protein